MPATARRTASRDRILAAAAASFRARGFAATGIDAVMAEAGLTHGGFYAHFASKTVLLQAALGQTVRPEGNALLSTIAGLSGADLVGTLIDRYLSMWHRDHPECGCPLPTLGAELPRSESAAAVCEAMAGMVRGLSNLLAPHLPGAPDVTHSRTPALVGLLVGGMVTARALPAAEAEPWLAACRREARRLSGLATETS